MTRRTSSTARTRIGFLCLGFVLSLGCGARSTAAGIVEDGVAAAKAAVASGSEAEIARVARTYEAWRVVDTLCLAEDWTTASALAERVLAPEGARLRRRIAEWRTLGPPSERIRDAFARVRRCEISFGTGAMDEVIAIGDALELEGGLPFDVLRVRRDVATGIARLTDSTRVMEAVRDLERAGDAARVLGWRAWEAQARNPLIPVLHQARLFEIAYRNVSRTRDLAAERGDVAAQVYAERSWAEMLADDGRSFDAVLKFRAVDALQRSNPSLARDWSSAIWWAASANRLGLTTEAIGVAEAALAAIPRESSATRSELAATLGAARLVVGDLAGAGLAFDVSYESARADAQNAGAMARALIGLASVERMRGNLARCRRLIEQASSEVRRTKSPSMIASVDATIAAYWLSVSDPSKAESAALAAQSSKGLEPRSLAAVTMLRVRAAVAEEAGRVADAVTLLEAAIEAAGATQSPSVLASLHGHAALLRARSGSARDALIEIDESIRTLAASHDRVTHATLEIARGEILSLAGRLDEGVKLITSAVRSADEGAWFDLAVLGMAAKARCEAAASRHADVVATSIRGLELAGRLSRGASDVDMMRIRADGASFARLGATAALQLARPDDVYRFIEAGRARAFLDELDVEVERGDGEDGSRSAAELERSYASVRDSALALENARARGDAPDALAGPITAHRLLLAQSVEIESRAASERRSKGRINDPSPESAEAIRRAVPKDSALVELFSAGTRLVAAIVTAEAIRVVDLGEPDPLAHDASASRGSDISSASIQRIREAFVDRLALPSTVGRVYFAPDVGLHRVPFRRIDPGRDWILIPSGSAWLRLRTRVSISSPEILAVGGPDHPGTGPLPASVSEARGLSEGALVGAAATIPALRSLVKARSRVRALHFGGHVRFDPEIPALGGLLMTPSGAEDDGVLRPYEVAGLGLRAELVVLAGCGSARGASFAGEGTYGLPRAFLVGGARAVLSTLWSVDDDAAATFVRQFYDAWLGRTKEPAIDVVRALRVTQERMKSDPRWSDPKHWAGWVLEGAPP